MKLWNRWNELWETIGGTPNTRIRNQAFARLNGFYSETHRAYHTMMHIEACLAHLDRTELSHGENRVAIEWAIWLHDAVYDPHRTDNEEQSTELSSMLLGSAGVGRAFERFTTRLILATKFGHVPKNADEQLLVDIDHSILGEQANIFDGYDVAVRREYKFVTWPIYCTHRRQILEQFLARKPFFFTAAFRSSEHETRVSENLTRAIERLATQPDPLLAS